ncbi:MAG: hypothetical protein Ct9H300mP12_17560 [Acidimicrobiales bacterium]|nr:MAG: hypothetical protein Ct9H300mP12_17560 [Acidimicrobiales bacterium]
MALAVTGHLDEAEAAYRWLVATQHENGPGTSTTWLMALRIPSSTPT